MPIQCWAEIRRNYDGVVRKHGPFDWWDDQEYPEFIWADGNFACDCNRALFFARAVGEDDPNRSCGMEAFSVRVVDTNGVELYSDMDEGS